MRDHNEACLLFHSGELSEAERREFERHLGGCRACAQLLATLDWGARVAKAGELEAPARARVRAVGAARGERERRPAVGPALALAALALALWPARRPAAAPSWAEIDRETAAVRAQMDDLSSSIARSGGDVEIEDDLRELETEARRLRSEL